MTTDAILRVRGRSRDHVRELVHELIIAKDLARERAVEAPRPPRVHGIWNKLMPPPVRANPDPFIASPFTKEELNAHPHVLVIARTMRYDERRIRSLVEEIHASLSERSVSESRLDSVIRGFLRKHPLPYEARKKPPA
jgi:hypothetical protein